MSPSKRNRVASILALLRNKAQASGEGFSQLLQAYAMERFIHRVSQSAHARSVILKGALLLRTIGVPRSRPTMDIDMLREGSADRDSLLKLVKECAAIELDDGVIFDVSAVAAEEIDKDGDYIGTRVTFLAKMDNVRLNMQIDFACGDVMVPGPRLVNYPGVLTGQTELLAYPIESAIAEKLEAIVALGNSNSRMKDFYDVWLCSQHLSFDETLCEAVAATFKKRNTPVPSSPPVAFTQAFVDEHSTQWNAFVRKIRAP